MHFDSAVQQQNQSFSQLCYTTYCTDATLIDRSNGGLKMKMEKEQYSKCSLWQRCSETAGTARRTV